jgi:hydrogenase nickel incorporation protein HypB
MCETCGCSDHSRPRLTDPETGATVALDDAGSDNHNPARDHSHGHDHHHHHDHDHRHHGHDHDHAERVGTTVVLETAVLARNDRLAERNRGWLAGREILALNLVSSPGAGKTTLLERTIRDLGGRLALSVIEGDQETLNDAARIRATGCRVVQINTGTGCHLDASMLARGLEQLDPPRGSVVFIENVGNLVCPALFDLGERAKVLIASVTEGDDKPLKYPHMFRASALLVLNKIDLLPHVPFDEARFLEAARHVNPALEVVRTSATRGDGLEAWYDWLRRPRG